MRRALAIGLTAGALSVVGCGEDGGGSSVATLFADGGPECETMPWIAEPDVDLSTGSPSAEQALRPFLEQWQALFGGDVVIVDGDRAALQVDGERVVVAYTVGTDDGGFAVAGSTGCDGFEPDVLPGPP